MSGLTSEQLEALNLSAHTLVTANAGSGKTFILTKRFLETIRQTKIKYNQIVAITFTEKAAAELLLKISKELDEILDTSKAKLDYDEIRRLQEFREYILSAKISTIHSFCFDILKEFPIEAGIDPSTEIIDELKKKDLIKKSVEETLIQNLNDEKVKDILRIFGKEITIEFISNLIEKRYFTDHLIQKIYEPSTTSNSSLDQQFEIYLNTITQNARDYFEATYSVKFKQALQLLPQIKNEINSKKDIDDLIEKINSLEKHISSFLAELNFKKIETIFESIIQTLLTKELKIRKSYFKGVNDSSAISQFQKIIYELRHLVKNVNWETNFEKEKYLLTLTLIDLYKKAKDRFQYFKTLEGVLDFDDLLILTDYLLNNDTIKQQLKNRFLFILVDEFQDTDSIQFNIIKKIAGDFQSENIVFVVGDEKQSIYGFRNAQLQVFQNFKSYLRELEQKSKKSNLVTLSTSYRSSPSIAAFVNHIFSRVWKNRKDDSRKINYHQEVEYSPLKIGREKYSDESVTFIISDEDENQSEKIGSYILNLVESETEIYDRKKETLRKVEYGDFALLFRTRAEMKDYESAFIKQQIPFVVSGGRGYFQSEELQDWINYINFLSNPRNDDSLLAILRSPFFALDDNLVLKIALQDGNSFFEKFKNYSRGENSEEFVKGAYQILENHLRIASRYTIPELLQTILDTTNYFGKINYHPKKTQIIANIKKLINIAHTFETSGLEDLKSFSQYLREAHEREEVSEAVISEIKGSVQFMTIHQSKGLEFPIVILPNFEKELKSSSIKYGQISINDYFGFCFKLKDTDGENFHTLSSFFGNQMNEGIDFNEQLRLLYVALTRATEKLVISFYHFSDSIKNNQSSYKQILLNQLPIVGFDKNNSIKINSKLTFIKKENDVLKEFENDYELRIELLKDLPSEAKYFVPISENMISKSDQINLFFHKINDKVKEEIFTATQLNVYSQCPVKYYLKFIIGYSPFKQTFSENLDEDEIGGADFGFVFHQMMEKLHKADLKEAEELTNQILENYPQSIRSKFKNELLDKLSDLLLDQSFVKLISHPNSLREFEIRIKLNNHILLGIIDRINIHDNEITIIDYKTDSFPQEKFEEKIKNYLTQMEFYILLVSEFFKLKDNISFILYFINLRKAYTQSYSEEKIKSIKEKFSYILTQIEQNLIDKNFDHCSMCEYSINSKCII